MLGKLIKHEFLTTGRFALPSYIGVAIVSLLGFVLSWISTRQYIIDHVSKSFVNIIKVIATLISTVYIIGAFSIFALTLALLAFRFYKNFYTDEGYLMHTLPVHSRDLIFAKLFNSWIWIILSTAIIFGALYLVLLPYDSFADTVSVFLDAFKEFIEIQKDKIKEDLGIPYWLFVVEIVAWIFALINFVILTVYSSVSFGMLISKKHKALGTLVLFIGAMIIYSIAFIAVLAFLLSDFPSYFPELVENERVAAQVFVLGSLAFNLILDVAQFVLTNFIMTHRLNLD